MIPSHLLLLFFFNDTATTEIYTLSLHDALPILRAMARTTGGQATLVELKAIDAAYPLFGKTASALNTGPGRSEEHTSELQSRRDLVCRLLLEKKKKKDK